MVICLEAAMAAVAVTIKKAHETNKEKNPTRNAYLRRRGRNVVEREGGNGLSRGLHTHTHTIGQSILLLCYDSSLLRETQHLPIF